MEPLPWVWTRPATGVSTDSATLQADFRMGARALVEVAFEYREAGNATWTETARTSYAENGSHDQTLAGLTPDTRYEFRARLTYDGRTLTGTVHTFTPRDSAANFSARSWSGAPPLVTRFHANGTTDPTARYRWDFGDGATSRLPEPTHIYTAGGRYTVTLTVTDTEGSATLTLSDYVYAWDNQVYLPLVLGD
jgi:PKD repeat protein